MASVPSELPRPRGHIPICRRELPSCPLLPPCCAHTRLPRAPPGPPRSLAPCESRPSAPACRPEPRGARGSPPRKGPGEQRSEGKAQREEQRCERRVCKERRKEGMSRQHVVWSLSGSTKLGSAVP
ncbi:caskin-2-like [Corvus kubaryi]|uniref:caskin-2-like n=1 Tax=Corvus kubaryi TaxID=68294 RepID=UPI001C049AD5|nr:caskin-2-like [Corvus kubaryi]